MFYSLLKTYLNITSAYASLQQTTTWGPEKANQTTVVYIWKMIVSYKISGKDVHIEEMFKMILAVVL